MKWDSSVNLISLILGSAFLLLARDARADSIPAFEWTGSVTTHSGDGPWALGWEFQVTKNLQATHVGVYDDGANGLALSHSVGIFNLGGTLLGSANVLAGTGSPVEGHFRYAVLAAPVNLNAGVTYIVAAANLGTIGGDDYIKDNVNPITQAPGIQYLGPRWVSGSALVFPSSSGGEASFHNEYMGGSFKVTPEPASGMLLLTAAVIVGLSRRRRH